MSDVDTLARHEAKTEPPKRWRNRWLYRGGIGVARCHVCRECVTVFGGDEFAEHCETHATKSEAETAAARDLAKTDIIQGQPVADFVSYLGPIPEPAP